MGKRGEKMKVYEVKVLVEVESGGVNGSYPTPNRIRDYAVIVLGRCMGSQRDATHKVEINLPIKVKGIFASVPEPLKEDFQTACERRRLQDRVFKAIKKAVKGVK